jgi:hypothetical protein
MRRILLVLACLTPLVLSAADLMIVRVWPAYRTADSFTRISEFFSGRENTRGETVLRSQPATREGFYFLTRFKNSGPALTDVRVELQVITPSSAQPRSYSFAAALPSGTQVLNIGLTGSDWSDASAQPVAWHLKLVGPDGRELAREQSFLWSMDPAAQPASR